MGVKLRGIIKANPIEIKRLKGKIICIDASNALYQFLAIIRQPNGTPLKDRKGNVTSHISGLFYRTVNLIEEGVKPIYVFDGQPPSIKEREIERRKAIREKAERMWKRALEIGDLEAARKYAQASARLTDRLVKDAKELLSYMGIPYVVAPEEGEAQAAHMVRRGDAWATASQDYDSLLFGSPILVRNLAISGRRKLPGKNVYIHIQPEIIELRSLFEEHGINRRDLIAIGVLIGTDFNEGIKGIGPKTALKLIKKFEGDLLKVYESRGVSPPENLDEIIRMFEDPKVTNDYKIAWSPPNEEEIIKFLCDIHDFSYERVRKAINRLVSGYKQNLAVSGLERWF